MSDQTFAQLRQLLGFGVVRLKLLLAIRREACLDCPGWSGEFRATIGPQGQVKAAAIRSLEEVRVDDEHTLS